jgi:phosphoribosylformylglycinamidine synthase
MADKEFKARVTVTLKNGVLDPQGKAIEGALESLDFNGVSGVRQGKVFDVNLTASSEKAAEDTLGGMCEKLLANTVIEDYAVEIVG